MRIARSLRQAVVLALAASSLHAGTPKPEDTIATVLQERYPGIRVLDVKATDVPGLYEVFTGEAIAYSDASGEHLVTGALIETRTKKDLTAASMDARTSIDFSRLPVAQAIKVVKGNGSRQIAVFADPDCPFCQKLEHELATLTDVTVYTYLFPLTGLHPDAANKARAIWCSPDPATAWTQWMLEKKPFEARKDCSSDPLNELQALGNELHINSTPTIFLANGRRLSGAFPAAQINALLEESKR